MAWNGKCPFESTRESLLNLFDFFENAILRVQYPKEYPVCSRLNHCAHFCHYCASLAEERKKERKKERSRLIGHSPQCVDLPVWYSNEAF